MEKGSSKANIKYNATNGSVYRLVARPESIDRLSKFSENIKAYGRLEQLEFIVNRATNEVGYDKMYNDLKTIIIQEDSNEFIKFHDKLFSVAKNEEDCTVINTLLVIMLHKINKDLEHYPI